METLLTVIAIWLSVNFGLPAGEPYPRIEFHPRSSISGHRVEAAARRENPDLVAIKKGIEHPSVIAFYDDDRRTIFLTEGWSAAYPKDVSILVHEFVHHLQNLDGRKIDCPAERERLAYRAQDAWLRQFQTTLEIEFAIDPMTLLVRTKCMH